MPRMSPEHSPRAFPAEQPLFMLYTSGSTGKPKGLVHTSGGYILRVSLTHRYVFDYQPGDIMAVWPMWAGSPAILT
jgi:acetyl-CoA synthetase